MLKEIVLQYSLWEELPADYQAFFIQVMGNQAHRGRTFYTMYFYWYNIAHECAHVLRKVYGMSAESAWAEERAATEFAVAYWLAFGEEMRLGQLGDCMRDVLAILPNPILPDEDAAQYFNAHYEEMSQHPSEFAYIHSRWVLDALERRPDFLVTLRALVTPEARTGPAIAPRFYPDIDPDLPLLIIPDMRALLAQFDIELPAVELVRGFTRALQFVSFG